MLVSALAFAALVAGSPVSAQSQTAKARSALRIEACKVDYSQLGRHATFEGMVLYRALTDEGGRIVRLKALKKVSSAFVRIDQLECCIMSWVLEPSAEYTVTFRFGTTLSEWSILLSGGDADSIHVTLPRSPRDCSAASEAGGESSAAQGPADASSDPGSIHVTLPRSPRDCSAASEAGGESSAAQGPADASSDPG
jgi:hypothetical protein